MTEPFVDLAAAIASNDTGGVAHLLERYSELKSRLDDALPGEGFGATPLLRAVYRRNRDMVDLLLRAGANIDQRSHWWAGSFGVLDNESGLHDFLIERGATVDACAASRHGMLDRLQALVVADPSVVHMRGGDGQTPLHVAKTVEIADFLLSHGADVDARDVDHESTPAQYLVKDRPEVARYLVARGCKSDLLLASALGDVSLVRGHLDADPSSIRVSVSEEWFPKQDPRAGGCIYIWTLGQNKTAHGVAHELGHHETYRLLMERSPDELKLARACELGDESYASMLLGQREELLSKFTDAERRRIVDAAQDEDAHAVHRMLEVGWPVDARGHGGSTALHWAGFHGNAAMVRELLGKQPPLEARDVEYDATPLFWTVYGSEHGWHRERGDYLGAVTALLDAGAVPPPLKDSQEDDSPIRQVVRRRSK